MNNTNPGIFIAIFFNLFALTAAYSQIEIAAPKEFAGINESTTYLAIQNIRDAGAQPFVEIFQQYWTLTELEYIDLEEVPDYLESGNSFLSFNGYETTVTRTSTDSKGFTKTTSYTVTHLFLS